MKTGIFIISGIIILAVISFFIIYKPPQNTDDVLTPASNEPKKIQSEENQYQKLRSQALSITLKDLGITYENDATYVYGVVMDWEMGGAVATTIAFRTGDASLYLSSGGAVIGGGQHKNVNLSAKKFMLLAGEYIDKAQKTEATPLPGANRVKFYLLTNKGIYYGEDEIENMENKTSPWYKLFTEGNKVLGELRAVSEKK